MLRTITISAAIGLTGLAVALAIASAASRAASPHSVALLAALSVSIVLSTHLATALLRSVPRLVLWPIWLLCLAGALYAHASFLTAAARDAAAAQLASSPATAGFAQQRQQIERALEGIKARPAAKIAQQLSWTTNQSRAAALRIELEEARRADVLRDKLIDLSEGTAAAVASATGDPVAGTLAGLLGVRVDVVTLAVSLVLAFLLEVLGMLLWREVFRAKGMSNQAPDSAPIAAPQKQAAVQAGMHQIVQVNVHHAAPASALHVHDDALPDTQTVELIDSVPSDDVARLRAAIERGECQPTVEGIRRYMRVGQTKAQALRRTVVTPLLRP